MNPIPFRSSCDWIARWYENAQVAAAEILPPADPAMPASIRRAIGRSLPVWQSAKVSVGRNLRSAAARHAGRWDDPAFLSAVELLIREEHRQGARLGAWLDAVGIPRRPWSCTERVFRWGRHFLPDYAQWAVVATAVESLSQIYFASLRALTTCPRLRAECGRILADEAAHLRFHGGHLALNRRLLPRGIRHLLDGVELVFFLFLAAALWLLHGELFRAAGLGLRRYGAEVLKRFARTRRLVDPDRYRFGLEETWRSAIRRPRRLTEAAAIWMR